MASRSVNWWKHMRLSGKRCGFSGTSWKRRQRQRQPRDETNEKMTRKAHDCSTGRAWRCVTLEKASSLLLSWQWSLLGNCVAMARVSSVMQTWPHPPIGSPAVKSSEALLLTKCQGGEQELCVFSFAPCFFVIQDADFSLHCTHCTTAPSFFLLSVTLTHDPSPFQGEVSSRGAGMNMECAETARRPTSFIHSSFLV